MASLSNIFSSEHIDLGNGNHFHFINIPTLDPNIIAHIDANIVSICEGATDTELATIKQRLKADLTPKKGSTLEMGTIAEFFGHLYLTEIGFKQEFLFLNLEERSIKKGFDGYYSLNNETWIFESKSGSIASQGASHQSKVSLAYSDLKDKISGNPANNPWKNAYNHASHIDVSTDETIRKNLQELSRAFTQGTLSAAAQAMMTGQRAKDDSATRLVHLKQQLANFNPKGEHPSIQVTQEQLLAAIQSYRAAQHSHQGQNMLTDKPKAKTNWIPTKDLVLGKQHLSSKRRKP
jgi:hypothetical protein